MSFDYLYYEIILIPFILFFLWLTQSKVLKDEPTFLEYIIGLLIILTLWGEAAIYLKQWYFPKGVNLGIYLFNHPIELYLEALITPILILSVWELVKRQKP